jgi:hypothetical protein
MRIRFGFSGLVNIQRQLGEVQRDPPRLIAARSDLQTEQRMNKESGFLP